VEAEEAQKLAEKSRTEAEEARKLAEDMCARGKETIQRWRDTISSASDQVQADKHGLLEKFGLEPPEMSQEENVEVSKLFHWIRACVAMAKFSAHFKYKLSETVAALTLSAAVCGLLLVESGSSMGIPKAQLRMLQDSSFEWPSLDSLRPDALPCCRRISRRISRSTSTRKDRDWSA